MKKSSSNYGTLKTLKRLIFTSNFNETKKKVTALRFFSDIKQLEFHFISILKIFFFVFIMAKIKKLRCLAPTVTNNCFFHTTIINSIQAETTYDWLCPYTD